MFDFILYFSLSNKTKQIAESFDLPVVEIHEELPEFNRIIIICPTYGDEELPWEMESFLLNLKIANKDYAICEVGNYFGYDWSEFGAATIIKHELTKRSWHLIFPVLTLDATPKVDWGCLKNWKDQLFLKFKN